MLPVLLLLGLAQPASAQSTPFEWPPQIMCHVALASGEVASVVAELGDSPKILSILADTWAADHRNTTMTKISANDRNTSFEFELSDADVQLGLSLWAMAENQFGIQIDYPGSTGNSSLPVGNGVCEAFGEGLQESPIPTESLIAFLWGRPFEEEPVCHAVSKTGQRISYSIPPTENGDALFKPISGLPNIEQMRMDLIMGHAQPEGSAPNLTTHLLAYSADRRTRGWIKIFGQPARTDWMFVSSMNSIEADRSDQIYFAGHCGGEIE